MQSKFVFLLFCSFCFCQTYYLSTNGNDGSSCSSSSPCLSLQGILQKVNDSPFIIIYVFSGTYSGSLNIGINFNDISVSIINYNPEESVIFMDTGFSNCFIIENEFYIEGITLQDCGTGIISGGESNTSNVFLNNSIFYSGSNGIIHSGNNLIVNNCTFYGVYQYPINIRKSNSITISNCTFEFTIDCSILLDTNTLNSFILSDTLFKSGAAFRFSVSQPSSTNYIVKNCSIINGYSVTIDHDYYTDYILYISGGNWIFENIYIGPTKSFLASAISYESTDTENNNFIFKDSIIDNASTYGIGFSSKGSLTIENVNIISLSPISINDASSVNISFTFFIGGGIFIFGQQNSEFTFYDVTFVNSSDSFFNLRDNANVILNNVKFINSTEQILTIMGGTSSFSHFIVDNVYSTNNGTAIKLENTISTFYNSSFINCTSSKNGGALYAVNSSVTFNTCSFSNNSGIYGGAIYLVNTTGSFITCSFDYNIASQYGGGINIESTEQSQMSTYLNLVKFDNNIAYNGAAISYCESTLPNCKVELIYDNPNAVTLSNNINKKPNGSDISCDKTVNTQGIRK